MESYKGGSWAKNLGLALVFTGMFTGSLVKGVYGSDKLTKTYDPWEGIPRKNIYLKYEPVYEPPELKKFSLQGKGESEKEKKPEGKGGKTGEKLPPRYLKFDLSSSPLDNHDANSEFWYSANQLAAKGTDLLGVKLGFDKKVHGRLANTFLNLYLSGIPGYYSHEMAHDFINREHGVREGFGISLSEWWGLDLPGLKIPLFPGYEHSSPSKWWEKYSKEEFLRLTCDGLNQDELNAKTMWERSLLEGNVGVHNRIPYLLQKFSDTFYVLACGFDDVRPGKTGLNAKDLIVYLVDNRLYDDVNCYTLFLYNEGVDMTKAKYFAQTAFSDFASWHTLESIAAVVKYINKGEKETRPATIRLAKGIEFTPPLFTQYMTSNGSFANATFMVNPGRKNPVSFSLGKYIGPAKERGKDWRVGAQVYGLSLPLGVEASPYLYLDMDGSSFVPEGISAGSELFLPLKGKNGIWARFEHNENDIVENRVKGKRNGLDLRFGFKIKI